MYGTHFDVYDLHASYEWAVVKIYDAPWAVSLQRFTLLGQAKRAELERDRLRGRG